METQFGAAPRQRGFGLSVACAMPQGAVITIAIVLLMMATVHDVMGFEWVIIGFSAPFILIWSVVVSVLAAVITGPLLSPRLWPIYGIVFAALTVLGAIPATYFSQLEFEPPFFVLVAICGLVGGTLIGKFVPRRASEDAALQLSTELVEQGAHAESSEQ